VIPCDEDAISFWTYVPAAIQSENLERVRIKQRRRSAHSAEALTSISFRASSNAVFHPVTPICPNLSLVAMMQMQFGII
jgi:hypothetical protein